jgi:hypothetical protein
MLALLGHSSERKGKGIVLSHDRLAGRLVMGGCYRWAHRESPSVNQQETKMELLEPDGSPRQKSAAILALFLFGGRQRRKTQSRKMLDAKDSIMRLSKPISEFIRRL